MSPAIRSESPRSLVISASRSPRRGDPEPVAALQHQIRGRDDVDVAASDPADDGVEPFLHAQLVQFAADAVGVGQRDSPKVDVGAVHPRFLRGRPAQVGDEAVDDVLAAGEGQQVPGGQRLLPVRDDGVPVAGQPRHHRFVALAEAAHGQVRVADEFERAHDDRPDLLAVLGGRLAAARADQIRAGQDGQ